MSNTISFIIIAVASYLLGSFNSAIVVSRFLWEGDIRNYGSGNAGLTNAYRNMGGKKTLLVLFGDILKGLISVIIGGILLGDLGEIFAGLFVVLGHVYPIYFGFKGGKGVLTGATMLALFDWRIFLVAVIIFVLTVAISKYISLGSILAALSFPILTMFMYDNLVIRAISIFLGLAVVILHRANIKRLMNGNENKFVFKKNNNKEG